MLEIVNGGPKRTKHIIFPTDTRQRTHHMALFDTIGITFTKVVGVTLSPPRSLSLADSRRAPPRWVLSLSTQPPSLAGTRRAQGGS